MLDINGSDASLGIRFDRRFEESWENWLSGLISSKQRGARFSACSRWTAVTLWPGRLSRVTQPAAAQSPDETPQVSLTLVRDRKRKKPAAALKQRLKCKTIKCKKSFLTARGCNSHMTRKHLKMNLTPYEDENCKPRQLPLSKSRRLEAEED